MKIPTIKFRSLKLNKIIEILINGNIIITAAWGFINPFFAVFVTNQIKDGSLLAVGIASTLYWIVKSALQMPIAKVLDKLSSEDDDAIALMLGSFLISLVPFGFLMATQIIHIYFLHIILAFGDALRVPSWNAIFTRHVDKGKEGISWGLNSTLCGYLLAIATLCGGWIAEKIGFQGVFIFGGVISILGSVFFLALVKYLRKLPSNQKVTFKEFVDYLRDGMLGRGF